MASILAVQSVIMVGAFPQRATISTQHSLPLTFGKRAKA